MENFKHIDLTVEELDALILRAEKSELIEGDAKIIKALVETVKTLSQAVDDKAASIKRLLQRVFGSSSEKSKDILNPDESDQQNDSNQNDKDQGEQGQSDENENGQNGNADASDQSEGDSPPKKKKGGKPKGCGKNGKDKYHGAERKYIEHEELKPGQHCLECKMGKVYLDKDPITYLRVTGNSPVSATLYELEKLRCNLCGAVFVAKKPEEAGTERYDESAKCIIALLRYGSGFPFYRLEKLQESLGVPLPDATQWDLVNQMHGNYIPVLDELVRQAAQGQCIHNDDTTMTILALCKENNEKQPDRTGVFTTGMVSICEGFKIAIFATGRKHAGENIDDLLEKRQQNLPPPIQMCDALDRNRPKNYMTLLANCLTHGRRYFVDILDNFPQECQYLIKQLGEVYRIDAQAKEMGLTDEERLELHQSESAPVMQDLHRWLNEQLQEKKVEPNSGLGKAMSYMLNHWDKLTLFLREPGAPLDNNICERTLKMSILHRKNSMFYLTQHGAYVGDLFMSIIHTCRLNKVNPFDYLISVLKYSEQVRKAPENWMPWNYKQALQDLQNK